jgi:biotin transport system ATP-binding protein
MIQAAIHSDTTQEIGSDVDLAAVSFDVDGQQILHDITFKTNAARVGIVGRNGSGKSTLARILAGLITPTSGVVRVNGHNLAKDRRAALAEVGILFQNPDHQIIFPTVIEEVSFGLTQTGHSDPDAAGMAQETLNQFNKSHWRDANISTLSQGQKHLVCLMSVVAMAPKLLILDEPFAGLDIPTKTQLNRYLSHYSGSLLHITHDPADLQSYDHLIWLDQGAVQETGPCDQLLKSYQEKMNLIGGQDDISDLSD